MNKIRKGDEVIVLTGRDKKRRGTVLERIDADHVLVEGINMVKKHVRPNPTQAQPAALSKKQCLSRFRTSHCSTQPLARVNASAFKKSTVVKFVFIVPAASPLARKHKGAQHVTFPRALPAKNCTATA